MSTVYSRWVAADAFLELYEDSINAIQDLFECAHVFPNAAAAGWQLVWCGESQIGPGIGTQLLTAAAPPVVVPRGHESQDRVEPAEPCVLNSLFQGFRWDSSIVVFSGLQVLCHGAMMIFATGSVPSVCALYAAGAGWGPALAAGEVWRLITPIFLHASNAHLIVNILFQCRLGFVIERSLGTSGLAKVYLGSGALGNLFSAAYNPFKISVGASTSVMGILGASVSPTIFDWLAGKPCKATSSFWVPMSILFVSNLSDQADRVGHCCSFIAGMVLAPVLGEGAVEDASTAVVSRSAFRGLVASAALACVRLHYITSGEHFDLPCPEHAIGVLDYIQGHVANKQ
eukprot:TRINITY_DN60614_c0_g1_i1.p1 TRINITY_DN60614_c0_g1~~TRINITY_DN60614_c0_g1_i1.p1  ORF type:complete len:343 (+),score=40.78 TRINITY_DN60614_c0_g1_i1:58-1086(+)